MIKNTSTSIKTQIINSAIDRANKLYTNRLIVIGEDSESYLSTQGFNAEYLGISNSKELRS